MRSSVTQWPVRLLSEIAFVASGGTPSKSERAFWGGKIPWYSSGELNKYFTTASRASITETGLKNSNAKVFPVGSLLIGMYDTAAMKMSLLDRTAAFNQAIAGVEPNETLDLKFLKAMLEAMKPEVLEQRRGTRQKNLSLQKIKSIRIPIPPVKEQKRIVAVLDQAFAALDRARAHAKANLADAQTLFLRIASDNLDAVAKSGQLVPIGSIAEHCLGKMLDKHKNRGVGSRYLRNLNVRWFEVETSDVLEMKIEKREQDRYSVRRGDLLICEGGYPGRASIYESDERIYFQKALHRVRFDDAALAKILMYWLYVENQAGRLKEHFTGTGISHFTGQVLDSYPMPVSSGARNAECVRVIEKCRQQTAVVEHRYRQQLTDIADLRQSLLQKAFTGELT